MISTRCLSKKIVQFDEENPNSDELTKSVISFRIYSKDLCSDTIDMEVSYA